MTVDATGDVVAAGSTLNPDTSPSYFTLLKFDGATGEIRPDVDRLAVYPVTSVEVYSPIIVSGIGWHGSRFVAANGFPKPLVVTGTYWTVEGTTVFLQGEVAVIRIGKRVPCGWCKYFSSMVGTPFRKPIQSAKWPNQYVPRFGPTVHILITNMIAS